MLLGPLIESKTGELKLPLTGLPLVLLHTSGFETMTEHAEKQCKFCSLMIRSCQCKYYFTFSTEVVAPLKKNKEPFEAGKAD